MIKGKPFVKLAGIKRQIIDKLKQAVSLDSPKSFFEDLNNTHSNEFCLLLN